MIGNREQTVARGLKVRRPDGVNALLYGVRPNERNGKWEMGDLAPWLLAGGMEFCYYK